jgi:hypothetical protein
MAVKTKLLLILISFCFCVAYVAAQTGFGPSSSENFSAAAQQPSADCTTFITPIVIELGQGVPMPRTFSNPTDNSVTFKVTMLANPFFGPAREVDRVTVAPRSGSTQSEPPRYPTSLRTPLTTARLVFEVTTNHTGADVVGRCDYQLTTKAPPGVIGKVPVSPTENPLTFLYQVPVRMCVLEGSVLAAGKQPGETISGSDLLKLLDFVNNQVWYPNAQIAFSTSVDRDFPVIADPSPPSNGGCGQKGDLTAAGFGAGDGLFAETTCANAWQQRYPGRLGIPIILARDFCNSGSLEGGAMDPGVKLMVKSHQANSGQRGDDLCGVPRRLTVGDITNDTRRPFVILIEPAKQSDAPINLAHELGHNLFLGHGNGFDDNSDGKPAGTRGPRRYDEYCDPGWLVPPMNTELAEEVGVNFIDCAQGGSLMREKGLCPILRPLQVETARAVAKLMPGFADGTPGPPAVDPGPSRQPNVFVRFWRLLRKPCSWF